MSEKQITVDNVRAVGMHHHGPKELIVGGRYWLTWEPDCLFDLGNAMAVRDHHGFIRAYLTRTDAYAISSLYYADVVQGRCLCKPVTEAHVMSQQLGPQHECRLKFKTLDIHIPFIAHVLTQANITYSLT